MEIEERETKIVWDWMLPLKDSNETMRIPKSHYIQNLEVKFKHILDTKKFK